MTPLSKLAGEEEKNCVTILQEFLFAKGIIACVHFTLPQKFSYNYMNGEIEVEDPVIVMMIFKDKLRSKTRP